MMRAPEVISADNGFAIVGGGDREFVRFDEVRAIIAYKRDELTSDLVCCDIVTGTSEGEQVRTVHEELAGFEALMTRFAVLPGFDRHSWEAVIGRASAADRRIVCIRITMQRRLPWRAGEAGMALSRPRQRSRDLGSRLKAGMTKMAGAYSGRWSTLRRLPPHGTSFDVVDGERCTGLGRGSWGTRRCGRGVDGRVAA